MNPQTSSHPSSSNQFTFSDEQLLSVCETSDLLACECPARLAGLLWEARTFYRYTTDCGNRFPEEAEEHYQLGEKIRQVDALLSQILAEFLQSKDLLDDHQQIDLKLLRERQLQAVSQNLSCFSGPDRPSPASGESSPPSKS